MGAKFFAVTSEQHQLGTQVKVWSATSSTDPGTLGYQNTNPAMPPLTNNPSPAAVTAGEGFKYECDWNNAGITSASFGLNANQELCVVIGLLLPEPGAGHLLPLGEPVHLLPGGRRRLQLTASRIAKRRT